MQFSVKRTVMQNKLKAWIAPNTVTEDPNDKILILDAAGNVNNNMIYDEMRGEDTGLRRETLVHVVTLYERIVARFLMNGYNVNTGLFYAVPRLTGIVEGGRWDPEKNKIYVVFNQDKVLRQEIANTQVEIMGEKSDVMYILETEDRKTGLRDGSMTPGRNLVVRGAYLRVTGDDPAVGITFRNQETSTVTHLDADMFATNNPSELILLIPSDLADGEYELTVTTQYLKGKGLLKTPRSVSIPVHIGEGGEEPDRPSEI